MIITERLIAIISPHNCLVCDREGAVLCEWCRPEALSPIPSRCYRCYKLTEDNAVCKGCRKNTSIRNLWAATLYEELPRKLLQKAKFERVRSACIEIAQFLEERLPYFDKDIIVVHVPTATSRRRQRGYDQSELIARSLAKSRGLTHKRLLARSGQARQVGATKQQRTSQMSEAFRVCNEEDVQKKTILLIDDLTTTGATLESAARTLRRAGAKRIMAATFAQKT